MTGAAANFLPRRAPLLGLAMVVAGLYFAREFILPLALAVLISFLLAPLIRRFERWHMGRVLSVLTATGLAFVIVGVMAYVVAGQMIDLANQLESYKSNLRSKLAVLKTDPASPFGRATKTMRELTDEIAAGGAPSTTADPKAAVPGAERAGGASSPPTAQPPVPVAVVYSPGNALEALRGFVTPMLGPLGTAAIVVVFVIFMLLEREDLRDRVIHLVGHGRLNVTTQALDEAARRVSRYLLAQLIVNVSYGIPVAFGLALIGIPNAVLWGFLAILLRFIPYLGPWIAAIFPVALSLAVSESWSMPLYTIGLFIVLELVSNNVIEPWLYGASTGLSPMAVIVSAVFWTWLWGTVGLLLATPLTVCIAVLGKYIPSLAFLDVLLGDKPPIAVEERFYQRLLALDGEETLALVEEAAAKDGLAVAFDQLVVPALRLAETDVRNQDLEENTRRQMYQILRDLIGEVGTAPLVPAGAAQVLCLPASNDADEVASLMFSRLLAEVGIRSRALSAKSMTSELVEQSVSAAPQLICVSTIPPCSAIPATHLCKRLRDRIPGIVLIVGLWGESAKDEGRRRQRVQRAAPEYIFGAMVDALAEIRVQPQLEVPAAITAVPVAPEKAA
ncbi:MAG TPA: AI-2E family transporter [Chthoniobacteraceae bacterium]|jgi:predicted PurR-regulated permease PerM